MAGEADLRTARCRAAIVKNPKLPHPAPEAECDSADSGSIVRVHTGQALGVGVRGPVRGVRAIATSLGRFRMNARKTHRRKIKTTIAPIK
jgi:hypothetical protein